MMRAVILLIAIHLVSIAAFALDKNTKGLLPEVRIQENNEVENDKKAFSSEMMITRSENKAIESLQGIIKKQKGSKNEADLWYRLAEMYMRRSKSGRFFEMHQNTPLMKLSPFPVPNEKGSEAVKRAIKIYTKIEIDFPQFKDMDAVLFNNAFANQQVGQVKNSIALYERLMVKFPKSPLIPDGTLALGELQYDQKQFSLALENFNKLNKYPNSRVYSYGMYKAAWTLYNLHQNDEATAKLVQVIKTNPPLRDGEVPTNRHNLRREAMRDLTIFVGESYPANKLYSFFEDIATEEELGQAISDLAKLYASHSRQKEMNIFLGEYIQKRSTGPDVVESHLALVEANEDLKKRDVVIEHLTYASELCKANSPWRAMQKVEVVEESCVENYRKVSLDMAKKWWDIWLKNKKNVEFSELTQNLFRLILENEDPAKPDLKTRYAYAELLFQLEKFDEASAQYKIVGDGTTDATMKHDADYAALFSKEKSLEKSKGKDPVKEADRKALAANYLAKHSKGKYATAVTFKMGHIAYEEANYAEAEKILKPLTTSKDADIRRKSEDLVLDMLNIKKDYAGIQSFSKQIVAGTTDADRKKSMSKIQEEAHFTQVQETAKTGEKSAAVTKLLAFAKEHEGSKLAQDALWQALSIQYSEGKVFDAAELSAKYVSKYPDDKRNLDAMKEAAKAYADVGQISKSAETLLKIADMDKKNRNAHLEMAADIYVLEKKLKEARSAYNGILAAADNKTLERIYGKLIDSYKNEPRSGELEKLQNQILAKGMEPYSTEIMIDRAKALLDAGKMTAAFDLAMKANGRSAPAEVRAEARLIQAKVLEKELIQQSVKANESKFAMVLGIKTEKLDKAHTAYFTTLKMSKDPFQQLEAMRGIDRCYGNYVEALTTMPLPASLSAEDKETLRGELAKLTAPILEKKNENEAKLKVLAASKGQTATTERSYASIRPDQTLPALARYPSPEQMTAFLPAGSDMTIGSVSRFEAKTGAKTCNRSAIMTGTIANLNIFETAGNCHSSKQYEMVERLGLELAKNKETRALGLFYASLGAEGKGFADKSLWMIEASLKLQPEAAPYVYQKARLTYKADGLTAAMPFFEKVLDMQLPSLEMKVYSGVKSFSEGDFTNAVTKLSALNREQLYTLSVGPVMSEAYAQKGEVDKALAMVKELLQIRKDNVDMLVQQAHLFETYKSSPTAALDSYERAYKASVGQADLREWLTKKIQFIKNQNKVGQHVISGDL